MSGSTSEDDQNYINNRFTPFSPYCDFEGIGLSDLSIDFKYNDTDNHSAEIAELYSYTELNEFNINIEAFEEQMRHWNMPTTWQKCSDIDQRNIILRLSDQLEVSFKEKRLKAARCILYLTQGVYAEVQSEKEQQIMARKNVMLLYEMDIFSTFVELLNLEIENAVTANVAMRKVAISLADSVDLRIIISVLYIITEVMRAEKQNADTDEYQYIVASFTAEINQPIRGELLAVKLFGMITKFCSGSAPHFPMKKVLLLLWKISLVGLGGMETLKKCKNEYRANANLEPTREDTMEIAKAMRSSSPPATATDVLDNQNPKRNRPLRRSLMKQSSLDEQEQLSMMDSLSGLPGDSEDDTFDFCRAYDLPKKYDQEWENIMASNDIPSSNRLPWAPKVRQKDIELFLDAARNKFIGFSLPDDYTSLAGLPQPIVEGFDTLKRHMYKSLADVQIKKEEDITRNPISNYEGEVHNTPAEILYQAILPNLPQYMIALLKILLAAAPTSKAKTESINIMADVLPEDMPMTVTQSTRLGVDVNRHKEIIVKAVSAILLLYLKHFKINHVYQFEFMSQHLVFANCIPLVLKFFNQNILAYVFSKNSIPIIEFPECMIGDVPDNPENYVMGVSSLYSWRNVFSCINLLRILNKLTKWKHSRIMMLVVFKSAPILKRTLKVRHGMMQLYVLKLLKMQTKYLGRQWRKSNMKTIALIYSKVRHRLNDDWAFGNDLDARPWDFQAEECSLRTCVDRFNNRRYLSSGSHQNNRSCGGKPIVVGGSNNSNTNYAVSDQSIMTSGNMGPTTSSTFVEYIEYEQNVINNINLFTAGEKICYSPGCIGWDDTVELSPTFKQNYELWLNQEVFEVKRDWDTLLESITL